MSVYLPSTEPGAIAEAIEGFDPGPTDVALVLMGNESPQGLEDLRRALVPLGVPFCGGTFPGLIEGRATHETGSIVSVLPALTAPVSVSGLDQAPSRSGLVAPLAYEGRRATALVLVDGLTRHLSGFLTGLFHELGSSVNYLGGGAGARNLERRPCLFSSEGVAQDTAIVTLLDLDSRLGVRHGWRQITGPLVATRTDANLVLELNWRPAFEVYREYVEADSGRELTREDFFSLASQYPFGLLHEGGEDVVRDPIGVTAEGAIECIGSIPENTVFQLLKGEKEGLVDAAREAAAACWLPFGARPRESLIVDCISRYLFLGSDFRRELDAVCEELEAIDPGGVPHGVLSLGEISSHGDAFLEFFNKTIVVGTLFDLEVAAFDSIPTLFEMQAPSSGP